MKIYNKFKKVVVNKSKTFTTGQVRRGNGGQVAIVATMFFMIASFVLVFGIGTPLFGKMKISVTRDLSKESFFLAESAVEDVTYRLISGMEVDDSETLTLNNNTASVSVTDISDGKRVTATGVAGIATRVAEIELQEGEGVAFFYGMQSGIGGIVMENSSSVVGNVYSGGTVVGVGNTIYGDVVSAGPDGLVDGIYATGTIRANTIIDSEADVDAYYQTIENTTVWGTEYPDSEDSPQIDLPISDEQIDEWKAIAETGGEKTCTDGVYSISSDETIGPVKIPCDFDISGNIEVTFAGHIWVEGDISFANRGTMVIDGSLGDTSVAIIADNPSDNENSGTISLENNTTYIGSGDLASNIVLISQNTSAENGGSVVAIDMQNAAEGDLFLYAGHGEILLTNNIILREVTAHTIHLQNSAQVIYESGVGSLLFSSGPSGGFSIIDWQEIE